MKGHLFLSILLVTLLFGTAAALQAETPQDVQEKRLDHIWKNIDFQKVGFPESLQRFEDRTGALLKHFRERPAIETERPWILNRPREFHQNYADNALKHNFVGNGGYPLQFRGKDQIDWISNPFPDDQWIIQFNRHIWMPSLAYIYELTRDERYAREWCFEINSWVNTGHSPEQFGKFPMWGHGLELASRMSIWPYVFERFRKSPSFDAETLINYLWSTQIHMAELDRYVKSALTMRAPSNHALHWQTGLDAAISLFTRAVDSAAVYVNASTRFTDGGEFGKGCEIGISTQKLHARGPMGLSELCSYKYVVIGNGQIR
ncbi:MAG: hypothetical protein J6R85_04795 [Lentisphaeria bacterium]|nr:hypothetical protein [Lentisphaeria bacterium]